MAADFDSAMAKMKALDEENARVKLRDQFAMAALTGLCAHPNCEGTYADIAHQVYLIADAMLAAREAG